LQCCVMCFFLCIGPRAIGVFHEALNATHHLHLFNYLAQLFTQAGIELPPSRQMKGEEEIRGGKKDGRKERVKGERLAFGGADKERGDSWEAKLGLPLAPPGSLYNGEASHQRPPGSIYSVYTTGQVSVYILLACG